MPSFLDMYKGSATDRMQKFVRAVRSFLAQDYENKSLIIASDGCELTQMLYDLHFKNIPEVDFVWCDKQPLFSGKVRHAAMQLAEKDSIITYLDTDDIYSEQGHLSAIKQQMEQNTLDWCWFDGQEQAKYPVKDIFKVSLKQDSIGCFALAHRIIEGIEWKGCDGYGHDWQFISKLMANKQLKSQEIHSHGYSIMHIPGKYDV